MIYTIGHTETYLNTIREHGHIAKWKGGYALKTIDDAQRLIVELNHQDDWSIWEMEADWETDTEPAPDGWWHLLIRNVLITRRISDRMYGLSPFSSSDQNSDPENDVIGVDKAAEDGDQTVFHMINFVDLPNDDITAKMHAFQQKAHNAIVTAFCLQKPGLVELTLRPWYWEKDDSGENDNDVA